MVTPGERGETRRRRAERAESISVIYVDDYEELCELTAEGLEEASDRLAVETTTEPSVVTDRIEAVDCVVADYAMPDVDGLELLRRVREIDEDLPFVLYTGKGDEAVASEAISLGVTDYLAKRGGPERFVRLAHRIENVVDARRDTEAVERTRQRARATVRRERARFRALVERSPAATVVLDETGRFEFLSSSIENLTGRKPEELQGESAFAYVHEADREGVVEEFRRSLADPAYRPTVEYRFRHADGEWRHLESSGVNRLDDPAVEGFVVNTEDVTERKRTERRFHRERGLADRLLGIAPSPVLVVDGEGEIVRASDRAADLLETTADRLLGLSGSAFDIAVRDAGDGDPPADERLGAVADATGRAVRGVEYEVGVPSGWFRLRGDAAPLTEGDGAVVAVEAVESLGRRR
jgi:PAS domain S-box-containing protein